MAWTLALLAAVGYAGVAVWAAWVAQREPAPALRRPWRWMALAAVVSAAWVLGGASAGEADSGLRAVLALGLDWLRQGFWALWLLLLSGAITAGAPQLSLPVRLSLLVAVVSALLNLGATVGAFSPVGNLLAPSYAGLAWSVLGLVLLEQLYRNAVPDQRWSLKLVCLGLAAMYGFDLYVFAEAALLGRLDEEAVLLRPVVHALGLPLLLVGSQRSHTWHKRIGLSREVVFHSAALLFSGAYLMLVSAAGYWLRFTGGEWGATLQLLLVVVAALGLGLLLMSGAMRARLRVWVSKHFLRYRYDYRLEWQRFTAALATQANEGDTRVAVLKALADLVESPAAAMWMPGPGGADGWAQAGQWNFERLPASLAQDWRPEFLEAVRSRSWIVDLNAHRRSPQGQLHGITPPALLLKAEEAWLVVPLLVGGELKALVVLSQPRIPMVLNWEVLDLLRSAAAQAAGYLALLRASEQLMEARKFEAFNRMSAFVVHDLKNIVTQLSLMLRNAERHGDNPEFRADMLETVDHAVEKMRQLMTQLREGERPEGGVSGVPLHGVLRRLQLQVEKQGRELQLDLDQPLATRGHPERVERVIGHAVQNALDASRSDQPVVARLVAMGSYACLDVLDRGKGMSAEFIRERLFKPFQTTKAQGMGIGVYESLQYVTELGGKMEVSSEVGVGTRVRFLLPLFHADIAVDAEGRLSTF